MRYVAIDFSVRRKLTYRIVSNISLTVVPLILYHHQPN